MRLPAAELLALLSASGSFSGLSSDSELSLLVEPTCNQWYQVKPGDTCDSIAGANRVPTYQIICENNQINGQCTNLQVGETICLGRIGEDCRVVNYVQWPNTSPESIAKQYGVRLDVFEANNYCEVNGGIIRCPPFHNDQVVCTAEHRIGNLDKCPKIFA